MRLEAIAASALFCLAVAPAIAEEPPAALVMAVSGTTTPPMSEMSEIPSGQTVQIPTDAQLTVLDYTRCKMITVSGGTLSVTRFDFTTDGKIVAQADAPCPRIHQLSGNAGGAVAGGLVVRGLGSTPRWPLNREIVFAGSGVDKLKAAAIYTEDKLDTPLSRLQVFGHRAKFPADAPPLAVNGRYVLRLTMADRADSVDIAFIGTAPSGPSLLVVLRGQ
jgi:hypothetical protein